MKKTVQSSLNTLAHVDKSVLPRAKVALDEVAARRKAVASEINAKLEVVDKEVVSLKENVTSIIDSHHAVAVKLNDEVTKSCTTLEQTSAPYFIAELDASKQKLVSTISSMSSLTANAVTNNRAQNAAVKQSIQDFAINKIQCNKPAAAAPTMKECKYSTDLSSTPAEDEILKGQNFNSADNNDSSDSSEEASNEAGLDDSEEVDTSQDTNDDDNRSTMSSGSVSISVPSPGLGLKSRDINLGQATNSSKIPRKQSRPTVNTAGLSKKNKLPSSLRTPSESRKKMRM
jgi:hypothetical protein